MNPNKSEVPYQRGPNAEPAPEWEIAKATWRWAYEFHWISFGLLNLALAIYSIHAFARALRFTDKISRNLSCTVLSLMTFFGLMRAIYFFTSPYDYPPHFGGEFPLLLSRTLFALGFPCLTAGLAFIDVVFIEAASGSKVANSKLRSVKFLTVIITCHFGIVIIVDMITFLLMKTEVLYILCIVYFMIVAGGSAGRVAYSGWKLIRQNKQTQASIRELQTRYTPKDSATAPKIDQPESKGIRKVRIIVVLTTVTCFAVCVLQTFALYQVSQVVMSSLDDPEPWPYYAYQTCFRLTELAIACTIVFSVTPASRNTTGSRGSCCQRLCYLSFLRKRRSFYVSRDDIPSHSGLSTTG